MNTVMILILVLLGAKPVDLPKWPPIPGSTSIGEFTPVEFVKCEPPDRTACRKGIISYRDGVVSYSGDLPINEAAAMLVESDKNDIDKFVKKEAKQ